MYLGVALALAVFGADTATSQSGPVGYGYDELGRLVIVTDGAGNTTIYNYDAVGNLLSLQRIDPAQLGAMAIVKITPTQGRVGSAVSIFGKGFGATPAQNTVTFTGGAAATVTSASPTMLRVTVPSTVVDGPIGVTAATGTATSAQSFSVIGALTVTPANPSISAGGTLQFTATGPGGSSPPVVWTVNEGGATSVGAISPGGLYAAPVYVNQPVAVTITATDQRDATAKGSVTATIVAQRLVAAGQGVSVAFARAVTTGLQTSVSARIGGQPSATAVAAASVNIGPVISAVSPATGARGAAGLAVTLTGAGFTGATQVTFLQNNAPDATVTATLVSVSGGGTQATLSVSIASGAATGPRVVKITTPAGTSTVVGTGANLFTVQ